MAVIDAPQERLGRGITGIVLTGVLLGVAYNYLALQGPPPHRGLPWITEQKVFQNLEALTAQPAPPAQTSPLPAPPVVTEPPPQEPPHTTAAATTPKPKESKAAEPKPEAPTQTPPQAPAKGSLDVPDTGRPLMVQLPKVKEFWDAKAALIVDAREPAEYAQGHIPGAINVPADEAISDPDKLEAVDSGGRPIICYCGGGSCEVSIHLAEALVYQVGKKRVLVFMGGFPDWESAGYPVEK